MGLPLDNQVSSFIKLCDYMNTVVELSFRKGRVQTDSVRALCTQIFAARAYEAFLSGSKGHFNFGSFGPV